MNVHRQMRRATGEAAKSTPWVIALGVIAMTVLLVLAAMWVFGFGLWSETTAETRGETGVRERTVADGDYRIAQYDHFFDLCAAIQAKEGQIAAQSAERDATADEDRKEQLSRNLTALSASRVAQVAEYNADAAKAGTAGQFRDSSLPYQINVSSQETQCAG